MARANPKLPTLASACRALAKRRAALCTSTGKRTLRSKAPMMSSLPPSRLWLTTTSQENITEELQKPCQPVIEPHIDAICVEPESGLSMVRRLAYGRGGGYSRAVTCNFSNKILCGLGKAGRASMDMYEPLGAPVS